MMFLSHFHILILLGTSICTYMCLRQKEKEKNLFMYIVAAKFFKGDVPTEAVESPFWTLVI